MIEKLLKERDLPPLLPREEMLGILQREIYGNMPAKPIRTEFTQEDDIIRRFCAGHAVASRVTTECELECGRFTFPFQVTVPTGGGKYPLMIHINFRPDNPDRYMPTEEIIDGGFAVISIYYNDITSDDGDFTNGLAGILFKDGIRRPDDPGKIAMWAWAAQRALDYAYTRPDDFDLSAVAVCGHSRLGKTALVAAATDERFAVGYSNDSGCSGAALSRGKTGETVADIVDRFPFWFCENYYKYAHNESKMPFDQHYLIACIAPRRALIGSASEDAWANPASEYLACAAASPAFKNGFVCEDRLPEIDDMFFEGDIGYHMREGQHYFSRKDWQRLMKFCRMG